jgi:hypothetical protein
MDASVQGGGKPGERFPQGLKPAILLGVGGTTETVALIDKMDQTYKFPQGHTP